MSNLIEENFFIITLMVFTALTLIFHNKKPEDFSHPHTKKSPLRRSSRLARKNN